MNPTVIAQAVQELIQPALTEVGATEVAPFEDEDTPGVRFKFTQDDEERSALVTMQPDGTFKVTVYDRHGQQLAYRDGVPEAVLNEVVFEVTL